MKKFKHEKKLPIEQLEKLHGIFHRLTALAETAQALEQRRQSELQEARTILKFADLPLDYEVEIDFLAKKARW